MLLRTCRLLSSVNSTYSRSGAVPPPKMKMVNSTMTKVVVTSTDLVSGVTPVIECDCIVSTRENAMAPRRPENHMINCSFNVIFTRALPSPGAPRAAWCRLIRAARGKMLSARPRQMRNMPLVIKPMWNVWCNVGKDRPMYAKMAVSAMMATVRKVCVRAAHY